MQGKLQNPVILLASLNPIASLGLMLFEKNIIGVQLPLHYHACKLNIVYECQGLPCFIINQ